MSILELSNKIVCDLVAPKGVSNIQLVKVESFSFIKVTRKYPLRGYILGVLTHTTAWDRHWGGDETLN